MLSKSQARAFFLGGTVVVSALFLALSWHTVTQTVPEQTNEKDLTEAVVRGKEIFDSNNCMGCHTILGEGAYYAPELSRVYTRRGPEWIKVFIRDPQAMFPGERKMTKYDFSEQQLDDLVAFFAWIDKIDLNGFPPEPIYKEEPQVIVKEVYVNAPQNATAPVAAVAQPEKFAALCISCHVVGGKGGNVGPALDGIGAKFDADYLDKWLADPQSIRPGTTMPKMPMTDAERAEIVTYLSGL